MDELAKALSDAAHIPSEEEAKASRIKAVGYIFENHSKGIASTAQAIFNETKGQIDIRRTEEYIRLLDAIQNMRSAAVRCFDSYYHKTGCYYKPREETR